MDANLGRLDGGRGLISGGREEVRRPSQARDPHSFTPADCDGLRRPSERTVVLMEKVGEGRSQIWDQASDRGGPLAAPAPPAH